MNNKGFTLIEVLSVLVILSTVVLIVVVPNVTKTVDKTREASFVSNAKIITNKADAMYKQEKYKNNTNIVIDNKIYLKDIVGVDNLTDPYGGEYDKEKSFVEFKSELVDTVNVNKVYIYLVSCKSDKCHRIGTANDPVGYEVLNQNDVKTDDKN